MRVGLLNPFPLSYHGGIETMSRFLVSELEKKGIDVEVACITNDITRFTTKSLRLLLSTLLYPKLKKLERNVDIIQANSWCSHLLKYTKKPNIAVCHGTTLDYLYWMGNDMSIPRRIYSRNITARLDEIGYKSTQHVVAVSNGVKYDLIERYYLPDEKITTIPNGIPHVESFRKRENPVPLILAIGRLTKQKGFEYLIRAVPNIEGEFEVVILGNGTEYNNLHNLIRKLVVSDRVKLLGRRDDYEKSRLLKTADIFVCPSLWESFGIVVLEAMSHRIPVVASSSGGMPSLYSDSILWTFPRSVQGIADKVNELLSDEELRKRLGEEGNRKFREEYTAERMAEGYVKLYDELIR